MRAGSAPDLYIVRRHDELLKIWRAAGATGLHVLHVDFHDDMRGFLINPKRRVLYRTGLWKERSAPPDEGNMLGCAVVEGMVRKIHWVHGHIGGRLYDSHVVNYSSDWSALPHRISRRLRNAPVYPLEYEVSTYEDWPGSSGSIELSLDWDFFAAYQIGQRDYLALFDEFLTKIERADIGRICFCYSPRYVWPTAHEFESAVERLVQVYRCDVIWPNGVFLEQVPTEPSGRAFRREGLKWRAIRALRRRGIY